MRPDRAIGLPVETIAGLLAKNAAAGNALSAALLLSRYNTEPTAPTDEDENWLTPDEAAPILRKKKRWIYRNKAKLPFVRRSGRGMLCSEKGLRRWLERQKV